ncbi:hypothetical protein ACQP1G_38720 [Nocardia sp. CA-107356]|uniref:hypothetical protein n=1 Tax=Nocardia sp. CA-107356 TaxID=3239972 RepID=UPI003D8B73F9
MTSADIRSDQTTRDASVGRVDVTLGARGADAGRPRSNDPAATSFASVSDLVQALKRAAIAHGEHEKRTGGEYDKDWPGWYAAYMVAEQTGAELPV